MTAQLIADMVDGIIPLCVGIYGLVVLSKNTKVPPGLRKALKPLSVVLIATGVLFMVKPFFFTHEDYEDNRYVVKKINETSAGKYVDETTRMDSVTLGSDNEFIFNYTIVNMLSTEDNVIYRETLKANVMANMRNNPKVAKFLKNGTPIIIRYFSSDGILITKINLKPSSGQ